MLRRTTGWLNWYALRPSLRSYSTLRPDDFSRPLINYLKERGLVASLTNEAGLEERVSGDKKISLYSGADPSARSLHVGNLIPLFVLLHFHLRGHRSIFLVGGATGQLGDPSGRSSERAHMEESIRQANLANIQAQMKRFLHNGQLLAVKHALKESAQDGHSAFVNNYDWWKDVKLLPFLAKYGRHIRVNSMLARDSVKSRMISESGLGYNEFTYQILQAYDFYHLFTNENCVLQVGGNDQWGNITAGVDLISRLTRNETQQPGEEHSAAFGLTVPLLTTPSGEKFGKSAGNAVWLDPTMTKPYDLYQYFINLPDSHINQYLKMFTVLPSLAIENIMKTHLADESKRFAQKVLAAEVTDLIHGVGAGQRAAVISSVLFGNSGESHTADELLAAFEKEGMLKHVAKEDLINLPWRAVLSTVLGISKSEAGRLLKGGGVYTGINKQQIQKESLTEDDLLDKKLLIVRVGKTKYTLVHCK